MAHRTESDAAPLSAAQMQALAAAAARELTWGLGIAAVEARRWRARAELIPTAEIREDAIQALTRKRPNVNGAALFSVLPRRRNRDLLILLSTYQVLFDFLDNVNESHPTEQNGLALQSALIDALDPNPSMVDYYRHHPWRDDGGYLNAIVERCREKCALLASYGRLHPLLMLQAKRSQVLALNHLLDQDERNAALRAWAGREFPSEPELSWFELSAAAGGQLSVLGLLALASEEDVTRRDVAANFSAYWPWVPLATTMLDSFVDHAEDLANGNYTYIEHYDHPEHATERTCEYVNRAMRVVLDLPNGHRHAVIVSCMIAMYLSKDSACAPEMQASRDRILDAGGSLPRLLLPVLRMWRTAYGQRSA